MGSHQMTEALGMVLDLRDEVHLDLAALEREFQGRTLADRLTRSPLPPLSFPWWMRAVDHAHGCRRTFVAPLTDAGAMALAAAIAGLPAAVAALIGGALLGAFVLAGVYEDRSPLETQGVLWYPPKVATPFVIVCLTFLAAASALGVSQTTTLRFAAA